MGYDAPPTWELVERLGFIPHIRSRGEEREQKRRHPDARARRWVVEGTHSWLNRNRSILTRWCKKPDNNRALLHLASSLICWRRALAHQRVSVVAAAVSVGLALSAASAQATDFSSSGHAGFGRRDAGHPANIPHVKTLALRLETVDERDQFPPPRPVATRT